MWIFSAPKYYVNTMKPELSPTKRKLAYCTVQHQHYLYSHKLTL